MSTSTLTATLVPLYRRVSETLLRDIRAGAFAAGEALPTEDALCTKFGVSRITVRKALDELADRHLIVRRRGVGTFVADATSHARSVTLTGFIEELLSPNRLTIVREASVPLPEHVVQFAKLHAPTRWRLYEGTNHLADGAPLVHLHYYYPPSIASRLTARMLSGSVPPIKVVEQTLGVVVDHAEQIVEAHTVAGRIARYLNVKPGTAVLRAVRVYYDSQKQPIEIFDGVYHPTNYRYTATLYPRPLARAPASGAASRRPVHAR